MDQNKSIYIEIRAQIFDVLDAETVNSLSKEQLHNQLSNAIDLLIERHEWPVSTIVRAEYVTSLVNELQGLGPLQVLMEDESISDIMINGHDKIFIERGGLVEVARSASLMKNNYCISLSVLLLKLDDVLMTHRQLVMRV